jgi:hypothetical protein
LNLITAFTSSGIEKYDSFLFPRNSEGKRKKENVQEEIRKIK